jgi:hypothetical protein
VRYGNDWRKIGHFDGTVLFSRRATLSAVNRWHGSPLRSVASPSTHPPMQALPRKSASLFGHMCRRLGRLVDALLSVVCGRAQELFSVMANAERHAGRAIRYPHVVPRRARLSRTGYRSIASQEASTCRRGIHRPIWPPFIGRGVVRCVDRSCESARWPVCWCQRLPTLRGPMRGPSPGTRQPCLAPQALPGNVRADVVPGTGARDDMGEAAEEAPAAAV